MVKMSGWLFLKHAVRFFPNSESLAFSQGIESMSTQLFEKNFDEHHVMKDVEQDSIRIFKFQPNKGSIVIDEPNKGDYHFHILPANQ